MNDTTSQSMQPRRGARRWLALLASFTIVATMAGTASAEGGPSDDDIISHSAWGVYNTSRVFEPWASPIVAYTTPLFSAALLRNCDMYALSRAFADSSTAAFCRSLAAL